VIIGIWTLTPFIGIPYVLSENYKYSIALQGGKNICAIAWWDPSPITVLAGYISLVFVGSCACIMIFSYSSVIFLYQNAQRRLNQFPNETAQSKSRLHPADDMSRVTSKSSNPQSKANERLILTKCIALTGCFMISWIPFVMNVFVQQLTRKPTPSLEDNIILILVGLNTIMNSVMLLKFDLRVRSTVFGLLGFNMRSQMERLKLLNP
jgi:hypothetical protein